MKQEDDYIFEYLKSQDDFTFLNPFVILHAFRNPVYQRIMYLMFEKTAQLYQVHCDIRKAKSGAEKGGRRKRRMTKKSSRKVHRKKYTRKSVYRR